MSSLAPSLWIKSSLTPKAGLRCISLRLTMFNLTVVPPNRCTDGLLYRYTLICLEVPGPFRFTSHTSRGIAGLLLWADPAL